MQFAEKMLEVKRQLEVLGHKVFLSLNTESFQGKSDEAKEELKLKQKFSEDAIKHFWRTMDQCEALLILNLDKHNISNYIGGNSLLDMGYAHNLGQKIFLYGPVPDIDFYKTEIEAMRPTIINGNLKLIQ